MRRSRTREIEPSIIVRGGDVLHQVWPEERPEVDVPDRAIGYGELVLELLAAADLQDVDAFAWRHARDAGAVLALTHYSVRDVLAASVKIPGELSPGLVLDALHAEDASLTNHLASPVAS